MRGTASTVFVRGTAAALLCLLLGGRRTAGLFDDEEARKAILDLRQRPSRPRSGRAQAVPRATSSCSRCAAACST